MAISRSGGPKEEVGSGVACLFFVSLPSFSRVVRPFSPPDNQAIDRLTASWARSVLFERGPCIRNKVEPEGPASSEDGR